MSHNLERRFHNGTAGDLILITVGGEFKRALYVGQTKVWRHLMSHFIWVIQYNESYFLV